MRWFTDTAEEPGGGMESGRLLRAAVCPPGNTRGKLGTTFLISQILCADNEPLLARAQLRPAGPLAHWPDKEQWSRVVSEDVANELRRRCDTRDFVERFEDRRQLKLRLG